VRRNWRKGTKGEGGERAGKGGRRRREGGVAKEGGGGRAEGMEVAGGERKI